MQVGDLVIHLKNKHWGIGLVLRESLPDRWYVKWPQIRVNEVTCWAEVLEVVSCK